MFAGEIHAPRQIRLIDVAEPTLRPLPDGGGGEILFQPELGCLCGSDLIFYERDYRAFETVVGHSLHELIGHVVDSTGDRFQPGDRVLCVPENQEGLFERFVASEAQAIPLDPRPPEGEALMAQPLGTVLCALRKLPNLLDKDVVVVGQGPIGQLFCAALRNLGARHIIALDKLDDRLAVSPRMGATACLNPDRDPVEEAVEEMTEGRMADLVVEAVGHREIDLELCVSLCRRHGQILGFGLTDSTIGDVPWLQMHLKNLNLQMSIQPDFRKDFPLAMRWIGEGRIDVSPLITHRYDVADIQAAYELFYERRDGAIKVLIDFPRDG